MKQRKGFNLGCSVNTLTGAIKVVGDGVQEGVLRSQEPLHHRHLDQLGKIVADS